jgi:ABC-type uncharacterized transport system permease subunit
MTLIENANNAWKMFSVQAMAIAGSLQFLDLAIRFSWASIPEEMRSSLPTGWVQCITVVLMVLGIIGRLVQQWPKDVNKNAS